MNTPPTNGGPDGNIDTVAAQGTNRSKPVIVAQQSKDCHP